MPELPEVEEVRRTLEPFVLGVEITGVEVARADFVTPKGAPLKRLIGRKIVSTFRQGKKLFLVADDDQTLHIHLGMSGSVDCVPSGTVKPKHTHVTFSLKSGMEMRLRDPRRFGGLWYYATSAAAREKELRDMGPDALGVKVADFAHWKTGRGRLKQRLMAQHDVAGLGNIYVDESLWMSRLHPLQRIDRVTPAQLAALVEAIHTVLNKSIKAKGTTFRNYRDVLDQPGEFGRQLQVYGRGGEPCKRCGTTLKSIVVTARTTVFCLVCQRQR
jgi:formamidopyrimidine-DNA glycosylase